MNLIGGDDRPGADVGEITEHDGQWLIEITESAELVQTAELASAAGSG